MKKFGALRGSRLRRHRRMIRALHAASSGEVYARHEHEFRMAERLHRAGLVTAVASKSNIIGIGSRPFRELTLFSTEAAALRRFPRWCLMPRGQGAT